MKFNIKTSILIALLIGTLSYFLSSKKQKQKQIITLENQTNNITISLIDKKLAAPKPLNYTSAQNGLGINNNWRSR
jgi:hypothetical protein